MSKAERARSRLTAAPAVLVAVFATASGAAAHPHVGIRQHAEVVYDEAGRVAAIQVDWVFDKTYSATAIDGLDTNGDGSVSVEELHPLAEKNIEALKDYSYFVYARKNGQKVKWKDVTEYRDEMQHDGHLRMTFTVAPAAPIDPRRDKLVFRIYDPSYYIAIEFPDARAVTQSANAPSGCTSTVGPMPDPAQTSDIKSMLATKGTGWQPEDDEDFGIMFAQPVTVHCK
ncbi:MAG: DUF1007 family protein [Hyphomicrobiales bacterium]